MIIKRDFYLNQLINHQNDGFIKIISGLRRCGKSYLMFDLFAPYLEENGVKPDHIISIQLDTADGKKYRNPEVCNEYVKSLLKDKDMYYLLLDEVQMMEDFESVLNGFYALRILMFMCQAVIRIFFLLTSLPSFVVAGLKSRLIR